MNVTIGSVLRNSRAIVVNTLFLHESVTLNYSKCSPRHTDNFQTFPRDSGARLPALSCKKWGKNSTKASWLQRASTPIDVHADTKYSPIL